MVFFIIILLGALLELSLKAPSSRFRYAALISRVRTLVPHSASSVALLGLVITFAVQLLVVNRESHLAAAHVPWYAALPIPTVFTFPVNYIPESYRAFIAVSSVLEACLLALFVFATFGRPWSRADTIASAIAASTIVILAVASPAMTVADMYAYVGYALLGPTAAYAPPATEFTGAFSVIHHLWSRPIIPAAYGPLWLYLNAGLLGLATSLYAKLILLRLVNVAVFAVILWCLKSLKVAAPLIAAFAACPAIAFQYITNGHNDFLVIAVVLAAMTLASRSPVAAGFLAGIGASLKLSVAVPAIGVALVITSLRQRFVYVAIMLGTAACVAVVLGGKPYFHALSVVADAYSDKNQFFSVRLLHVAVVSLALTFTVVAVLARRTFVTACFAFISLAQAYYPWYMIWGLPYAAVRSGPLALFIIVFPILTSVLESTHSKFLGPAMISCLVVLLALTLVRGMNTGRSALTINESSATLRSLEAERAEAVLRDG